jgi:hypothetical protein
MALSGAQVTRMSPYGGSMGQYGDFTGKDELVVAPSGGSSIAFLVYAWIWDIWA